MSARTLRIPFGSEAGAEFTLAKYERRLAAAEARKAFALAWLGELDQQNPDHFDLINTAGEYVDMASDAIGEVKDRIEELEGELYYAVPSRRAAA